MKPLGVASLLLAILLGPIVATAQADLSADDVRQAIDKGVSFLKGQQNRVDGSWPDYGSAEGRGIGGQPGGVTALCTLALLNAGVDVKDPVIQKALGNLRKRRPEKTYVV